MLRLLMLLHLGGFTLWLGGGIAAMIMGIRGRREDRYIQGAYARLQAALHRIMIGPGVILTVGSGIFLSLYQYADPAMPPSLWLMVMQGLGLVSGAIAVLVSWPTVHRLAKLEPVGETAALFDALRGRQAKAGMIWGLLGLVSLIAGVVNRV
jgi:hypothetical protein